MNRSRESFSTILQRGIFSCALSSWLNNISSMRSKFIVHCYLLVDIYMYMYLTYLEYALNSNEVFVWFQKCVNLIVRYSFSQLKLVDFRHNCFVFNCCIVHEVLACQTIMVLFEDDLIFNDRSVSISPCTCMLLLGLEYCWNW